VHFEILVEDYSGKTALDAIVPKIIGEQHTFLIHSYKGIGRIPRNMRDARDASKRILMENLPKLLKGYGRTQVGRPHFPEAVILVCDLDDKCLKTFRQELHGILNACDPQPITRFCIAVEEGEAWLLGDLAAIKSAYPRAKDAVLNSYVNDSICNTWERLAEAVYPGGSAALCEKGYRAIGVEKSRWAEAITLHMDIDCNTSPSFQYFVSKIREPVGLA